MQHSSVRELFLGAISNYFGGKHYSLTAFRSNFGVSTKTAFYLYIFSTKFDETLLPEHVLLMLHFLKNYPTNTQGAQHWNCDPKTYRKYLWKVLSILFVHLKEVDFFLKRKSIFIV